MKNWIISITMSVATVAMLFAYYHALNNVKQASEPLQIPGCVVITDKPQDFSYQGGNGGFSVTPDLSFCTWSAKSNVPWIHLVVEGPLGESVVSVVSGTANGSINYTVDSNNYSPIRRTGTISVVDQTLTIVEDGR